jgi:hypothetical protein
MNWCFFIFIFICLVRISFAVLSRLDPRNVSLTRSIFISNSSNATFKLISLIGVFFASENVKCRSSSGELNVRVSMSSDPAAYTLKRNRKKKKPHPRIQESAHDHPVVEDDTRDNHLSTSSKFSTLSFSFTRSLTSGVHPISAPAKNTPNLCAKHPKTTYNNNWNPHESQQPPTFFVMLTSRSDLSSREFIDIFRCSCVRF